MTRRELTKIIAWALCPPVFKSAHAAEFTVRQERRYRADAQVLVLSVPILRRTGVGGGSAAWREWRDNAGMARQLEFTGYSSPERAAGLNRLGLIRETSHANDVMSESSYLGVMTASPEESAEEARKALHSNSVEATYAAIRGHTTGAQVETTNALFRGPSRLSPEHWNDLLARAEKALSTASGKPPEFHPNGAIPPPFLHALADLLRSSGRGQTVYVYNGRLYQLRVVRSADARAADYFRERRMIPAGARVVRVAGKLRRETGGKQIDFRIWVEESAQIPIPLRIDFQPKGYLRLIFEAEA